MQIWLYGVFSDMCYTSIYQAAFSIAADVRPYSSSNLRSLVAYLYWQKIGRLLLFWGESGLEYAKYSIFPNFFKGEPQTPLPLEKGHYCISVTNATPTGSPLHQPTPLPASIPPSSNVAALGRGFYTGPHW